MTAWIQANPVLFSVVLWPILVGIVTALFKARTPEEYSKMNPRVAAFLKLLGSLGLDVPNMMNALKQLFAGTATSAGKYRAERMIVGQPEPPTTPATITEKDPP